MWTNRYDVPGIGAVDSPSAIAVDSSGNVFVTGSSPSVGGGTDYGTVAYSEAGVPLWTNRGQGGSVRGAASDHKKYFAMPDLGPMQELS